MMNKYIKTICFTFAILWIAGSASAIARDLTILPPDINLESQCQEIKKLDIDKFDWTKWTESSTALTDEELYERAELYYYGSVNTPQNWERAVRLINHLSEGSSKYKGKALKIKARMLIEGKGVTQDTEKAKRLLEDIIKNYDRKMVASLARIYQNEGNYTKAVEYYKQAVVYGVPSSALALAYLYSDKRVPASDKNIEQMLTYAQNLVLQRIAQGDCKALFNMGTMYTRMKNVANHEILAAKWYEAAARVNYVGAKLWLAALAQRGVLVDYDHKKILRLWHEAANLGSSEAMYFLGNDYAQRAKNEKDFEDAFLWLKKSAKRHNIEAIEALVEIYNGKYGKKPDDTQYFYYLKQAEKNKKVSDSSLFKLANVYELGALNTKPELEKAFSLYQLAAKKGNTKAIFKLGQAYRYGIGVQRNSTTALRFYRLAFEQGSIPAIKSMIKTYECGVGKESNIKKAALWKERRGYRGTSDIISRAEEKLINGSDANIKLGVQLLERAIRINKSPKAMALLGLHYQLIGDNKKMNKWNKKALKADIRKEDIYEAHFVLGKSYLYGNIAKVDVEKGLFYLTKAAENGNKYAYYALAMWYREHGEEDKSIQLFKKAVEKQHVKAMMKLADLYRKKDQLSQSVKMLKKAAQHFSVDAMLELSNAYDVGGWIKPSNKKQSYFWLEEAAKNYPCSVKSILKISNLYGKTSNTSSNKNNKLWQSKIRNIRPEKASDQYQVSKSILNDGKNLDKEQIVEALNMLKISAETGYSPSVAYLAELYLNGYNGLIEKDVEMAISYLEKAAEQGDVSSMIELSNLYVSGIGVEPSFVKAMEWLEKAKQSGSNKAAKKLEWLKKQSE